MNPQFYQQYLRSIVELIFEEYPCNEKCHLKEMLQFSHVDININGWWSLNIRLKIGS